MDPNQTSQVTPIPTAPKLPLLPEKLLPAPHNTSWGALIGIIIIVVLLIIGALYFWGAKLEQIDSSSLSASKESSK